MTTFHVEINGGPEQTVTVRTGLYALAAMTALALLEYTEREDFDTVKIWVPVLLPDFGPYYYTWDVHQLGITNGQGN